LCRLVLFDAFEDVVYFKRSRSVSEKFVDTIWSLPSAFVEDHACELLFQLRHFLLDLGEGDSCSTLLVVKHLANAVDFLSEALLLP